MTHQPDLQLVSWLTLKTCGETMLEVKVIEFSDKSFQILYKPH